MRFEIIVSFHSSDTRGTNNTFDLRLVRHPDVHLTERALHFTANQQAAAHGST